MCWAWRGGTGSEAAVARRSLSRAPTPTRAPPPPSGAPPLPPPRVPVLQDWGLQLAWLQSGRAEECFGEAGARGCCACVCMC